MIKVLEERAIRPSMFIPVASERSAGTKVRFHGTEHEVVTPAKAVALRPDVALFSAGGGTSLEWAPRFAEVGCRVIDNSSAWRMDSTKKLIVPEVNGHVLSSDDMIIANPNCSTIQLVMVLWPLHREYGLKRVVVSTYQSVSGTGAKAVQQLMDERVGHATNPAYPHRIDMNCIPQCDVFTDNGYTKEEMKLVNESRKIMDIPDLRLTATTVRVPVIGGHSEAVNIEFERCPEVETVHRILKDSPGVIVLDDPSTSTYPMPMTAHGKDEVFVGRIRKDGSCDNAINLWIVADNLRKGAATNAVQILERLD
jgi:aspartate-semialdehyde dehydrogenase